MVYFVFVDPCRVCVGTIADGDRRDWSLELVSGGTWTDQLVRVLGLDYAVVNGDPATGCAVVVVAVPSL